MNQLMVDWWFGTTIIKENPIESINQLMVNCWFGTRWFGILGNPQESQPLYMFGDPIGIQTTKRPKPPTQTIS